MDIEDNLALFDEPEEFQMKLAPHTFTSYTRQSQYVNEGEPKEISLRLVGNSPLWGHLLWNAGVVTADYLDEHRDQYVKGKTVLELGAAAGLPSLTAALSAKNVLVTDYPDPDLVTNLKHNVELLNKSSGKTLPITADGYIWGNDVSVLLNAPGQNGEKFDTVILSDLVFNHSEHRKLLDTCVKTVKDNGSVLVVFTHHRPWLQQEDLSFFDTAAEFGFTNEEIIERKRKPMFENDPGSEEVRAMVYGRIMRRSSKV